jgi:hypothetical protein
MSLTTLNSVHSFSSKYKPKSIVVAIMLAPTLRWDALTNVIQSSNLISSWGDYSNTYFATQSTNKPTLTSNYINSMNSIVFTAGTNQVLTTGSLSGTALNNISNITIFYVFKITSNSNMQNFFSSTGGWTSGSMHLIFSGNIQLSLNSSSNDFVTGIAVPINVPFILMVNFSSATGSMVSYLRLNGASSSTFTHINSVLTLQTNGFDFGGWSLGGRTINGGLSELLIYNSTLTLAQIKTVEDYLSKRWNIIVSTA